MQVPETDEDEGEVLQPQVNVHVPVQEHETEHKFTQHDRVKNKTTYAVQCRLVSLFFESCMDAGKMHLWSEVFEKSNGTAHTARVR